MPSGLYADTTLRDLLGLEVGDALVASGGNEIETENGYFETSATDSNTLTIEFSDEHQKAPDLIFLEFDGSYEGTFTNNRMLSWCYYYLGNILNVPTYNVGGNGAYGAVCAVYYSTSTGSSTIYNTNTQTKQFLFSANQETTGSYDTYKPQKYATKNGFTISTTGTVYFLKNCKYNWRAYWLPEIANEESTEN